MEPDRISARLSWITEDLWPEILKRLPVKSLCRFRCVCKLWNSLSSSPLLINLHHSFTSSSTTPANLKPYLQAPYFRASPDFRCYDSYSLYSPRDSFEFGDFKYHFRHDVHFPFQFGETTILNCTSEESCLPFACVDVVNGLVCLSSSLGSYFDFTLLWNPAIHKFLTLPRLPLPLHLQKACTEFSHVDDFAVTVRFDCHGIGFGYDSSKNDFKVVRVWFPRDNLFTTNSTPPTYEVYSSREGLWRVATIADKIEPCFFDLSTSRTGCFVNATIHWVVSAYDLRRDFVLMFECEREEFKTVELPEEIYSLDETPTTTIIELLEYAGMLSTLVSPCRENHFDLWAMEEHGLASTWKKLFRIHTGEFNLITLNQPSFDKLAPYGPPEWVKFLRLDARFEQILSDHVYEESLFLMDDAKAQSYAKEEIVYF